MSMKNAYFAGGCFWGMEALFQGLVGVVNTSVGYTGGENENPTYGNHPGHAETLRIVYDSEKITYEELLDFFFRIHNPTTLHRQGNDVGIAYRSAIFYQNDQEQAAAEKFITLVDTSGRWGKPIVTTLEPFTTFYTAEDYHQDYLKKNPGSYTCHAIFQESYLEH